MTVKEYQKQCEPGFFEFLKSSLEIWSNDACMGYLIDAAQRAGLSREDTQALVDSIKGSFDELTVDEATALYCKSPY